MFGTCFTRLIRTSAALSALPLSPLLADPAFVLPHHSVTLKEAHVGDLVIDTRLLDSYGRLPKSERDFYLAAREHFFAKASAEFSDPEILNMARNAEKLTLSGPMLGGVSSSGVSVKFRPTESENYLLTMINIRTDERHALEVSGEAGQPCVAQVSDLLPDTPYTYQLWSAEDHLIDQGSFRTAPLPDTASCYRIAFGSCFHKTGVHNPNLMHLIAERGNLGMLLLGDSAVDDREARLNEHRADYLLRDVAESWREFSASVPTYASWDDHDYLNNDKSGLQKGQISPVERDAMRELWRANWNNPETPEGHDGIYFSTRIADVEVIMLDTRSCREWSKKSNPGSYLGRQQTDWLKEKLVGSAAKVIILTSGTMWHDHISNGKDSWGVWDPQIRAEIFQLIDEEVDQPVILLSGDRHGARGFQVMQPSGGSLYEFVIASLGGSPGPGAFGKDKDEQLFGYADGLTAFGEFEFDFTGEKPRITMRLIDERNQTLEQLPLSVGD